MAYCELQMIEFNVNKWACAAVLAAASAVCLSGCARDYPEPGKSAFKKAIEEYADSHKSCIEISPAVDSDRDAAGRIGDRQLIIDIADSSGKPINQNAARQLDLLAQQGYYAKKNVDGFDGAKRAVYTLQPTSEDLFMRESDRVLTCLGAQKVVKINFFTRPAPLDGVWVSYVNYQSVVKIDKLGSKLLRLDPNEKVYSSILEEEQNATVAVAATDKGWKDARAVMENLEENVYFR